MKRSRPAARGRGPRLRRARRVPHRRRGPPLGAGQGQDPQGRGRRRVRTILPPTSDTEAYVDLYYAEDARVLPPNQATVTGRAAILALLRSYGPYPGVQAHDPRHRGPQRARLRPRRLPDEPHAARRRRSRRGQGQVRRDLEEAAGRELEGDPRRLELGPARAGDAGAVDAGTDAAGARLEALPGLPPSRAFPGAFPRGLETPRDLAGGVPRGVESSCSSARTRARRHPTGRGRLRS